MGKIRIKTLGLPEKEAREKQRAKERKEARLETARQAKRAIETPPDVNEKVVLEEQQANSPVPEPEKVEEIAIPEKKTKKTQVPKKHGRKYHQALKFFDKNRSYPLTEAVNLVKKTSFSGFDGSIEVHINTLEKGVTGNLNLPHGNGKQIRIAIADGKLLSEIEAGKINFDILVASPEFMPKLAKFARILGPRGLMPNPKAGTISQQPEKVAEKFKKGELRFKTEAQAPLIHLVIGKTSFPEKNLEDNLKATIKAIGLSKIKKLTLSSSMGPGIKLDLSSLN